MPHFDLTAAEKAMRESLAHQGDAMKRMVEEGKAEHGFVRAQECFHDARLQFTLGGMRAENEGCSRDEQISAAGAAIGLVYASMVSSCATPDEVNLLNGWMSKSFQETMSATQTGGYHTVNTFKAEEGGHA